MRHCDVCGEIGVVSEATRMLTGDDWLAIPGKTKLYLCDVCYSQLPEDRQAEAEAV